MKFLSKDGVDVINPIFASFVIYTNFTMVAQMDPTLLIEEGQIPHLCVELHQKAHVR